MGKNFSVVVNDVGLQLIFDLESLLSTKKSKWFFEITVS